MLFPRLFSSLRSRNFRYFFVGQGISLIGTWMQLTAIMWLVWRLTHNPFLLGFVGFSSRIPSLVISPFAGVLIDRVNRFRLVLATQIFSMVQASLLALLMLSGHIQVWHIILLSFAMGLINSVDVPARQALLVKLIDKKEDLSNAIALNSSLFNGSRLFAPAIAGFLISLLGEGFCFLINAVSYIAVIGGLLLMRVPEEASIPKAEPIMKNLIEGFRYVFGFAPVRSLILLLALMSLVGASHAELIPIFAEKILHGDARTQGFLLSASACGAFCATMFLAMRNSVAGLSYIIAWAPVLFGGGMILMGLSKNLMLTLAVMPFIGVGLVLQMACTNTVLQTIVEDDKRGRVMSFYAVSFMGMVPIGSLLAGTLAHLIGAPMTTCLSGLSCILGAAFFIRRLRTFRELLRPIYVDKGILVDTPEVSGIPRDL